MGKKIKMQKYFLSLDNVITEYDTDDIGPRQRRQKLDRAESARLCRFSIKSIESHKD